MTTLVTGALGCIGAWVLRNLIDDAEETVVFDVAADPVRPRLVCTEEELARITFLRGDITDVDALTEALRRHRVDRIIHLAGLQIPACRQDPIRGAQVNVIGTLAVFEAARRMKEGGHPVEGLVYASSAAVFGPPEDYPEAATESAEPRPHSHYGVYKVANELNARVYAESDGITSIGLRPWAVYGPGRDFGLTSAPTFAIQAAVMGVDYALPYGGFNDLQFVDDVAKAFVRCSRAGLDGARVYNLRGAVTSMTDVIAVITQLLPGSQGRLTHGSNQLPIAFDLDDGRLRSDVDGIPRTPLPEGVRRSAEIFERLKRENRLPPLP